MFFIQEKKKGGGGQREVGVCWGKILFVSLIWSEYKF